MNASRGQNIQLALKTSVDEDVAGKQGEGNQFGSVFPYPESGVQRQKGREPLGRQSPGNRLLVVVPGIDNVPARIGLAMYCSCLA